MNSRIAGILILALGLAGCETEQDVASATQNALDELQKKYDELVQDKIDAPVEWASDDLENIGDWEYRVETISFSSNEDLATQLNDLGNDRWEVIWFERTPGGFMVVLKKPSISYLSKIPISQLGRLVIGGDGDSGQ